MEKHSAVFANFICHFGTADLIDYLEEIVLPAFLDDTLVRSYGEQTHYHLYEATLLRLTKDKDDPVIGIGGRFIKDTTLTRTQIFDRDKGLIHDEKFLQSSPSAFFVLILNNHRLIYFPETPHAPDIKSFEATISKFLKTKHKEFINELAKNPGDDGLSKGELWLKHPSPELNVVPLTGFASIDQFVKRYEKLQKFELQLIRPNADIDGARAFRDLRTYLDTADPKKTKIISTNREGLNKSKTVDIIHDATATGNQEVKLSGIDHQGNKLVGNNENFKVTAELKEVPSDPDILARKLFQTFNELVEQQTIKMDQQKPAAAHKIKTVLRSILNSFL